MSYQLVQRPIRRPARLPSVPLGQPLLLPIPQQSKPDIMKMMMTGLLIVILLMAFLWWLDQKNQKVVPNRNRASKQSTKEMANNLYKRLEKRGGANPGTLRSLKALGRK